MIARDKRSLWLAGGLFAFALGVRLLYLYESADSPAFQIPTVDAAAYDETARALAAGQAIGAECFWQPFFYPFFLSLVYRFSHSSITAAQIIQAVLGAFTCLLTYRLGERAFDRRVGVVAAVMTALYGPLIFLEGELVAAGWAAFWSVVLVVLFLRAGQRRELWVCPVLGVCGALAIVTRPTFLPFFAVACLWLAFVFYRSSARLRLLVGGSASLLAGFLLIAVPVAALCARATGRFSLLPYSGGINLYIGNNPDSCKTLTARPGWEWDRITALPQQEGINDVWEMSRYFSRRVLDYVTSEPLGFLAGLARKTWQFINSREVPRNIDLYLFGRWSWVLHVLLWKVGGFGFPFGVLLPLALLGLVYYRRRTPVPLLLFVVFHPLAVILVFVTARYRVEVIPVVSVLSAAGVSGLMEMVRRRRWAWLALAGGCAIGVGVLASFPRSFCEEKPQYEAELYRILGDASADRGRPEQAVGYYLDALRLKPDYPEVHNNLGSALRRMGRLDEATAQFAKAVRLAPDRFEAHNNLGTGLIAAGRVDEAVEQFRQAVSLEPSSREAHSNLAHALLAQGQTDQAVAQFEFVLRAGPNGQPVPDQFSAMAHSQLGGVLLRRGQFGPAARHLEAALQLRPDDPVAHNELAAVMLMMERVPKAIEHLSEALRLRPDYADAHFNMARAQALQGHYAQSVRHYREAIRLAPTNYEALNALAWLAATCDDPALPAPEEAVQLAERACQLTDYRRPSLLDTLAVAYAAAGDFHKAVEVAQQALSLAEANGETRLAEGIRARLATFELGRPYREER